MLYKLQCHVTCILLLLLLLLLLLGGIAKPFQQFAYCVRCYNSVVCPSLCQSVTLVHPAKAIGRNEMPFGMETHVVPSNTVLQGPRFPTGRGTPSQNLNCKL